MRFTVLGSTGLMGSAFVELLRLFTPIGRQRPKRLGLGETYSNYNCLGGYFNLDQARAGGDRPREGLRYAVDRLGGGGSGALQIPLVSTSSMARPPQV